MILYDVLVEVLLNVKAWLLFLLVESFNTAQLQEYSFSNIFNFYLRGLLLSAGFLFFDPDFDSCVDVNLVLAALDVQQARSQQMVEVV